MAERIAPVNKAEAFAPISKGADSSNLSISDFILIGLKKAGILFFSFFIFKSGTDIHFFP